MKSIFLSGLFPAGRGSPQAALHNPFMAGFAATTAGPVLTSPFWASFQTGGSGDDKVPTSCLQVQKNHLIIRWNVVTNCRKNPTHLSGQLQVFNQVLLSPGHFIDGLGGRG